MDIDSGFEDRQSQDSLADGAYAVEKREQWMERPHPELEDETRFSPRLQSSGEEDRFRTVG